jgi:hypothetical protein
MHDCGNEVLLIAGRQAGAVRVLCAPSLCAGRRRAALGQGEYGHTRAEVRAQRGGVA